MDIKKEFEVFMQNEVRRIYENDEIVPTYVVEIEELREFIDNLSKDYVMAPREQWLSVDTMPDLKAGNNCVWMYFKAGNRIVEGMFNTTLKRFMHDDYRTAFPDLYQLNLRPSLPTIKASESTSQPSE